MDQVTFTLNDQQRSHNIVTEVKIESVVFEALDFFNSYWQGFMLLNCNLSKLAI